MSVQSIYQTFQRYRTLRTDIISSLPIVILMPHSACNCRCVMCDIWKGNKNVKQLTETDIKDLLGSLKKLGTQQVLMSGGEALLNPSFFRFCELLRNQNIRVTLLSTGLTLQKNAAQLVRWVNDIIVSLDGDERLHDEVRNIPGAYQKLKEGVDAIKSLDPSFRVTGRTVIHRLNFRSWSAIIDTAKKTGLDQVSFLPADVSSQAFNREIPWNETRQQEIMIQGNELSDLKNIMDAIITNYRHEFITHFIAESPGKLQKIVDYYSALQGWNPFPYKKCNAPWVSTVVEADGTVRPCFFHAPLGNIRKQPLNKILNSRESVRFRRELDMDTNETCIKCVCYLNLSPSSKLK